MSGQLKNIVNYVSLDLVEGKDSRELCEMVLKEFQNVPQGMTRYQIQKFVLGDLEFPTPVSKYWQAKLELWVRVQNIVGMHFDYRKRAAKIKQLQAEIIEKEDKALQAQNIYTTNKYKAIAEQLQVEIEENEFAMAVIKKTVLDKLKEMKAFNEVKNNVQGNMDREAGTDKEFSEEEFWAAKAEINPELKIRFPEVFNVSQQEYDKLIRNMRRK